MPTCPSCGGDGGEQLLRRVMPCVRCTNAARMRNAPPGLTLADLGVEPDLRWVKHIGPGWPKGEMLIWLSWTSEFRMNDVHQALSGMKPPLTLQRVNKMLEDAKDSLIPLRDYGWFHPGARLLAGVEFPGYSQNDYPYMIALVK